MSLRELTLKELTLVAGGEGEGNGGDGPGMGSNGSGDGQGNGASTSDGGSNGTTSMGGTQDGSYQEAGLLTDVAKNVAINVASSAIYDGAKAVLQNGPYGPSSPSPTMGGASPSTTPGLGAPQDGYNVDNTPQYSGPGG